MASTLAHEDQKALYYAFNFWNEEHEQILRILALQFTPETELYAFPLQLAYIDYILQKMMKSCPENANYAKHILEDRFLVSLFGKLFADPTSKFYSKPDILVFIKSLATFNMMTAYETNPPKLESFLFDRLDKLALRPRQRRKYVNKKRLKYATL